MSDETTRPLTSDLATKKIAAIRAATETASRLREELLILQTGAELPPVLHDNLLAMAKAHRVQRIYSIIDSIDRSLSGDFWTEECLHGTATLLDAVPPESIR